MEKEYIEFQNTMGKTIIQRTSDGAFIPVDEENMDYKTYLEWKEEQSA